MFVTIITDCSDTNAFGRQMTRASSLFGFSPIPVAITPEFEVPSDIEAGSHLIDMIDASRGSRGVILVNKAPRSGKAKKWKNGTPFGYFWYKETLVVSSIDGHALSLAKKFGLTDGINVFDIPTVMEFAKSQNLLEDWEADYVVNTQFRSFEFLPRVAKWVFDGVAVPTEFLDILEVPDSPDVVCFIDNFGNCKTTLLPEDIRFEEAKEIEFEKFGVLKCYNRLKDLPNGETGLIIGSSGLENNRLLEIMTQGESTKHKFNVIVGDRVAIGKKF
jgi:hypothetical protein